MKSIAMLTSRMQHAATLASGRFGLIDRRHLGSIRFGVVGPKHVELEATRQQDAPSHIETTAPPLTRPGPMRGRQPTCYLRQGYGDTRPFYSE